MSQEIEMIREDIEILTESINILRNSKAIETPAYYELVRQYCNAQYMLNCIQKSVN